MKSLKICTLAVSLCLISCSCSAKKTEQAPPELPKDISQSVVMEISGREYKADLRRGDADIWECAFTSPETVEGLTLTLSGEDCKLSYNGLEYTAGRSDIPECGAVPMLTSSIDDIILRKDITCTEKDGNTLCRGSVRGYDFAAEINGAELVSLDIPNCVSMKKA